MVSAVFSDGGLRAAFFVAEVHGDSIPEDAVQITDAQWQDWLSNPGRRRWDGETIVPYEPEPPAPTVADVIAERDRRLAEGFLYDFGDARGLHQIATTSADMVGWDEVTKVAQAMMASGLPSGTIDIITETGPVQVTAAEWMGILLAAGSHRQPIWAASFALQQMDPIPADFADNAHWPS